MSEDELVDRISQWVETSGRALELRTARTFRVRQATGYVLQSVAYEDQLTQAQREGDVLAGFRWLAPSLSATLELAVECKSGKDHPWVAFYDRVIHTPDKMQDWFQLAGTWPAGVARTLIATWNSLPELTTGRVATHTVSAFGKDGSGTAQARDGLNLAQSAARQALSFAQGRRRMLSKLGSIPDGVAPVFAILPVVVTQAPLFTCELSEDGEIAVAAVDGFDVWVYTRNQPSSAFYDRQRVRVVAESRARSMATALSSFTETMSAQPHGV